MSEPYVPQSRLLAQLFASNKHAPVQSVGQGLADVVSDITQAYITKTLGEKAEAKRGAESSVAAQELLRAMSQPKAFDTSGAQMMAGQSPVPAQPAFPNGPPSASAAMASALAGGPSQMQPAQQANVPLPPQQAAMLAFKDAAQKNPEVANQTLPMALQLAQMTAPATPKPLPSMKPGDQLPFLDPRTGTVTFKTAPGTPEAKPKNGSWAIDLKTGKPAMKTDEEIMASPADYAPMPTGMHVVADGKGGFEITTNGAEPTMTNQSKADLENTIIQGKDTLAKMHAITAEFKPEYQQIGTRAEMMKLAAMSKAGIPLDPAAQKNLTDFATYRRNAASNMNTAIKNATGVTVGKDEAPRLMNEIPNPGSGLFDGDDPITFQAKVDATTKAISSAVARAAYARDHGLTKDAQFAIPLDDIPKMINRKGDEYARSIKSDNPSASDEQIKEMVKARLRKEFDL